MAVVKKQCSTTTSIQSNIVSIQPIGTAKIYVSLFKSQQSQQYQSWFSFCMQLLVSSNIESASEHSWAISVYILFKALILLVKDYTQLYVHIQINLSNKSD